MKQSLLLPAYANLAAQAPNPFLKILRRIQRYDGLRGVLFAGSMNFLACFAQNDIQNIARNGKLHRTLPALLPAATKNPDEYREYYIGRKMARFPAADIPSFPVSVNPAKR
jgi:hypothetical protein